MRGYVSKAPLKPIYKLKLSPADRHRLIRKPRIGPYTARMLRDSFAPAVYMRILQQILNDERSLRYVKMSADPNLTSQTAMV